MLSVALRPSAPAHLPAIDPLVAAAAQGDRAAAGELARRLVPRVRNLVRYLVRGDQDVEDIAQEALVALLRGLPSYRGEGELYAWADRVVARATFAWLRHRHGEQARSSAAAGLHAVPADEGARPDEYLRRRRLVRHLDALPLEQRHALVLHHVLELTVPEIARELATPEETVRSRLRLARLRLRESLAPSFDKEAG